MPYEHQLAVKSSSKKQMCIAIPNETIKETNNNSKDSNNTSNIKHNEQTNNIQPEDAYQIYRSNSQNTMIKNDVIVYFINFIGQWF